VFTATLVEDEKLGALGTAFLELVIVIGEKPVPRVTHDGELEVALEDFGRLFGGIAREVFVVLPIDAKDAIDAVASGLGNVNENAAVLVADHAG
jgi:hypothetical protein